MKTYPITPIPKPRMTQKDRWAKRPPVLRYRAFCDEVQLNRISLPESGYHVTFVLPMPESWSKKKRAEMAGKPHQQKPDADNLLKALMDAIYSEDCAVWDVRVTKRWGNAGEIIIKEII
uniref:Endodeoxyribonuclease RusA n=1 Tax=Serratia marcescens TaxID=615 RepID=A0A1C3H9K4_SERMA|nr:Endodeoxyribonuclease RusA [Serratia marcescens]